LTRIDYIEHFLCPTPTALEEVRKTFCEQSSSLWKLSTEDYPFNGKFAKMHDRNRNSIDCEWKLPCSYFPFVSTFYTFPFWDCNLLLFLSMSQLLII